MKHPASVFKRWAGKGYATYNSLKRVIKIGFLVVVYLKFANPGVVLAGARDDQPERLVSLDEIEVTGEALPESYSDVARVVVSISKKEIERAALTSISELIEYASNIDIRQRASGGMQADISIRGGSFDQVLILLNGINITDPQTGHHNLNLPLDFSSIERIEVLKGPGSWRFGPGAFSGAINIVTQTARKSFVQAGLNGGSFGQHAENLSAGLIHGNFSHLVSFSHLQSDGYTNNTDYNSNLFFYRGTYSDSAYTTGIQFGLNDKGFGANSFYSPKYPDQYEATRTLFAAVDTRIALDKLIIEPKFYYRRHNDTFFLFRDRPALYGNYHTNETWGTNLLANYIHNSTAATTFGIDSRTETIWSNNLGEVAEQVIKSPANDTILLNRFHSRTQFSVFIGQKLYLSKFTLNGGINFTRHSDQGLKWLIYPGLDLSFRLSEASSLQMSANKTMRMPTYTDLYYQGPVNQGNSQLKPEEATGFELGYQYHHGWLEVSLTGFYSMGRNLIDWIKESQDQKWQTVNYTQLNTMGLEVFIKADFSKIKYHNTPIRQIVLQYSYLDQEKINQVNISNYALNYLKHRIDLSLDHRIAGPVSAHWNLAWQDRNGQYEAYADQQYVGLADFQPFWLWDIKIDWAYKGWTVFGSVQNLLNVTYCDIGNIAQQGRSFRVGVSKRIGL